MTLFTLLLTIKIEILRLTPKILHKSTLQWVILNEKLWFGNVLLILADFDKFRPKIAYFYKNLIKRKS